jgi:hypothetical protein
MIVEERTYTAQPGKAKEWLDYYEKHAFPIQQKYLGRCLGFFTTELGTLNQIVHLWVYDNLAHRESARAKMAQDPDWHKRAVSKVRISFGISVDGCLYALVSVRRHRVPRAPTDAERRVSCRRSSVLPHRA